MTKAVAEITGELRCDIAQSCNAPDSAAVVRHHDHDMRGLIPRMDGPEGRVSAVRAAGGRRWLKPVLGIAVSAFFVWLVLDRLSMRDIGSAFARCDGRMIPLALASLGCGYAIRVTRWWLMLRLRAPHLRWSEAARPFLIGIAANNVLPLRVGDVLRMFAFRGRQGLEPTRVAGTLVIERLLDLMVLLLIFAIVLARVTAVGPLASLVRLGEGAAVVGLVAAATVFSLPLVDRLLLARVRRSAWAKARPWLARVLQLEVELADTIGGLGSPSVLLVLAALSVLVWLFEGGLFVAALAAFDPTATLTAAFFALAVATLATLVPSSPGYIGTFHFFAIQALLTFGLEPNTAAAVAIMAHLLLWLPTTLAGLGVFCWSMIRPTDAAPSHSHL